ncbi:hypothetical protein AVT69_gp215 [Pseudomonas phage PhiPA3]|uniref:Uncharacterized protein 217 n=1 Tax=Pseudomonas phage PhiPA3 TaxID=998086 RepID=F8SJ60_BPPA3|nr:hypothetical protein AVT69_gp215 [Pseudomonas phage PhiPA3]AEH03640.1 hypothetical protein [Pseudomonas phage PhiPA3]
MKGMNWALSLEDQEGQAQEVDVNNVESETEVKDLDQGNLDVDNANKESQPDTVHADTEGDVSNEEATYAAATGASTIEAFAPDKYGCPKRFVLSGFDASSNPAADINDNKLQCVLLMQNGTLPEVGKNGITAEDLLRVVEELFVGYQSGPFACEENESVLFHVRAAQAKIQARLYRRREEGTEGTYQGH